MTGQGLLRAGDYKTVMVGYHTQVVGNGSKASLRYRTWGPPVIGVAPVENIGTKVKKTNYVLSLLADQKAAPFQALLSFFFLMR